MQSSASPGRSDLFSFEHEGLQAGRPLSHLRLNLADALAKPSRASLPSPPMSESPPRRQLSEVSQIAGRRRKRSDSPPVLPPVSVPIQDPATTSQVDLLAPTVTTVERQAPAASYFPSYGPALSASSYGQGASGPSSSLTTGLQESQSGYTQLSTRATRKVKAHVASACVNCKKKHLRCDAARPCQRCVQSGKESTCYDVEHRKRGRPPLKPDDPSRQGSFEQSSSGLPASSPVHTRGGLQPTLTLPNPPPTPIWRDIRPIMSRGVSDASRSLYAAGPSFLSVYSQPSVASSATTAVGMINPTDRASYQIPGSQAPPSYSLQSPMGYGTPSYESYQHPQAQPRNYPGYMPQQQFGQPLPANYTFSSYQRPAPVLPVPEEGPVGLFGSSSLQLPPIRPALQGQNVEPAMAQQQRQAQPQIQFYSGEQSPEQGSSERPDAKRPRMDIRGILDPGKE